jgi:hypothetical protein
MALSQIQANSFNTSAQTWVENGSITTQTVTSGNVIANTVGSMAGSVLSLQSNGTTNATLDTNGNFGLGVTPNTWGSGWTGIDFKSVASANFLSSGSALQVGNNYYYNGTNFIYKNSSTAATYLFQTYDGQFKFYNAPSGTAGSAITFTQALTLDANGNLFVGETSISNPAGWYQGFQVYNANYPYLSIKNSSKQWDISGYGSSLYFWDATSGAARMVIDTNGNLLVGTTNTTGSMSNGQIINTGGLRTLVGSFAAPSSGAWTSIATITQAGMYLVHAYIAGYAAGPGNWSGCFLVTATGSSSQSYVYTLVSGNIQCQIVSNSIIQIYTGSGSGTTIQWVIARIG